MRLWLHRFRVFVLKGKIKSKTNHLNTQRVDAYIFKRKKNLRFQKYLNACGRGLGSRSFFSRKLSLLHRLLGLLIETGKKTNKNKINKKTTTTTKKNDPRNNYIFGTPFRSSFLLRSPFRIGECSKHQNSLWSDSHAGQWTTGVV